MSANIKRYWLQGGMIAVTAAIVIVGSIYPAGTSPTASAQTGGTGAAPSTESQAGGIAPAVWSQAQALRQELCLTNTDLAAMGMSQQDASRVLQTIVDWRESHAQACEQADREVRLTKRVVREA